MPDANLEAFREAVSQGIKADRQNSRKWDPLYSWFKNQLDVSSGDVGPKLLTQSKQLSNRIRKELAELDPRYVVLTYLPAEVTEAQVLVNLNQAHLPRARCAIVMRETTPTNLVIYERDDVVTYLEKWFTPDQIHERVRPVSSTTLGGGSAGGPVHQPDITFVPVEVPQRVRRMIKLALATSSAVVLVGPPGTGKTTLLNEVIDDARAHPDAYGLSTSPKAPKWTTPEESWTAADLVGGDTVDQKGHLRFQMGRILEAIADDRWLVLDELNRADMDKIFGALLTWLGGTDQSVELGRVAKNPGAPVIQLAWSSTPECDVENASAFDLETPLGDPVRFSAGTDWRLLGTYNAVDVQRVFRFGQAIGRRFSHVPIPPPDATQFKAIISAAWTELPNPISSSVAGLYEAHLESSETEVGPALFLRMLDYIAAGLSVPETSDPANSLSEPTPGSVGGQTQSGDTRVGDLGVDGADAGALGDSSRALELLAEAYLMQLGPYLAHLEEEDLAELRVRIVSTKGIFDDQQFSWILGLARYFA